MNFDFVESLIRARDSFDRRIADLEADLSRRPDRKRGDDRAERLEKYRAARERCERRILADYPETGAP